MKTVKVRTEEERLDYLNQELNTNYQSLDKVDWRTISACKTLSEDFIREFKDRVDWEVISFKQRLSEDFIKEFADRFNE